MVKCLKMDFINYRIDFDRLHFTLELIESMVTEVHCWYKYFDTNNH